MQQTDLIIQYAPAVSAIKTAILQGQYEAAKGVNRIQLAVYFAIGKYISVIAHRPGVLMRWSLSATSCGENCQDCVDFRKRK